MRSFALTDVHQVLCLGAHADDIEIGCGGTLLTLCRHSQLRHVHWIVFSASAERAQEARTSAERFLARLPGRRIDILQFRDGFFPYAGAEIKESFEQLKTEVAPDLIFTHYGQDLHQDHRLIAELTWNTFRNHLILEYEVPKYDGGLGSPNLFVPLALPEVERKLQLLEECFPSQRGKSWFDQDTFRGLMRLRGVECHAASRFAEGFYARKSCLECD